MMRCRRLILPMIVGLSLVSCAHWREQRVPVGVVVETDHPSQLRITRPDGTVLHVVRPAVSADSLLGFLDHKRVAIPLGEVEHVDARRARPSMTVGVVVLSLLGAAILAAAAGAGGGWNMQ